MANYRVTTQAEGVTVVGPPISGKAARSELQDTLAQYPGLTWRNIGRDEYGPWIGLVFGTATPAVTAHAKKES